MGVAVGFMFSAWAPVRDGAQAALFGAACLAVHGLRHKFRNLDPMGIMWLTWGVNMALYFASVAFIFPAGVAGAGAYAARVAVDAVFSSAAAALFSAYAVNLFRSVFFIFGVNLSVGED